jgi:hypothetical protein
LEIGEVKEWYVGNSSDAALALPENWEEYYSGTACLQGTVERIDTGAYEGANGIVRGEARLDLKVSEVFWGPNIDQVSVWFDGASIPSLVKYVGEARLDQLDYIGPGSEIVVKCWLEDECWVSSRWNLFVLGGMTPVSLSINDINAIRERGVRGSLSHQADVAQLICEVGLRYVITGVGGSFTVKTVLRGDEALLGKEIMIYWWNLDWYLESHEVKTDAVVVFLRMANQQDVDYVNKSLISQAAERGVASAEIPAEIYVRIEPEGSVLFRRAGGYVDFYGLPAEMPEIRMGR